MFQTLSFCESFQTLPLAGGLLDQSSKFLDAVKLIRSIRGEIEQDRAGNA